MSACRKCGDSAAPIMCKFCLWQVILAVYSDDDGRLNIPPLDDGEVTP